MASAQSPVRQAIAIARSGGDKETARALGNFGAQHFFSRFERADTQQVCEFLMEKLDVLLILRKDEQRRNVIEEIDDAIGKLINIAKGLDGTFGGRMEDGFYLAANLPLVFTGKMEERKNRLLRIAEIYKEKGSAEEAAVMYEKLARLQERMLLFGDAIATWKVVLELMRKEGMKQGTGKIEKMIEDLQYMGDNLAVTLRTTPLFSSASEKQPMSLIETAGLSQKKMDDSDGTDAYRNNLEAALHDWRMVVLKANMEFMGEMTRIVEAGRENKRIQRGNAKLTRLNEKLGEAKKKANKCFSELERLEKETQEKYSYLFPK